MRYQPRSCELCGSSRHTEVYSWNRTVRTRSRQTRWVVRNVVCDTCGFAFVAPAPAADSLREYYSDAFALFDGAPLGSAARIAFLDSLRANVGIVVELGGNRGGEFRAALPPRATYINCELNAEVDSDVRSLDSLPEGSTDVLVSYYVFEHVVEIPRLLQSCARVLNKDGLLVVEVPDRAYYPHMAEALEFHEHVNHFSAGTLTAMLAASGFRLVALSREHASRPFGFVAGFRKAASAPPLEPSAIEYVDAVACLRAGAHLVQEVRARLAALRGQIVRWASRGERLVLWAANQTCQDVIGGVDLRGSVVLLDSNPEKRGFVDGHVAMLPAQCLDAIRAATRLVIFSDIATDAIARQMADLRGGGLSGVEAVVVSFSARQGFLPLLSA